MQNGVNLNFAKFNIHFNSLRPSFPQFLIFYEKKLPYFTADPLILRK